MFKYSEERVSGAGLEMSYHLTPWDQPIFQGNTGIIASICLRDAELAVPTFSIFRDWCVDNRTLLVSCRLPQDRLAECAFLEAQGFRFIELNYRPTLKTVSSIVQDPDFDIQLATAADENWVCDLALRAFKTGRVHADPMIDSTLGDRRYAAWAANAFRDPAQTVLVSKMGGRQTGFMVVESPSPVQRSWALLAIDPDEPGSKVGRRFSQSVLAYHAREGVTEVTSSVSSLNVGSLNLHISLGFQFPAPSITLHWCPFGPVAATATL